MSREGAKEGGRERRRQIGRSRGAEGEGILSFKPTQGLMAGQ